LADGAAGDVESFGGRQPGARSLLRVQIGQVSGPPLQLQPMGKVNGGGAFAHPPPFWFRTAISKA